MEALSAFPVESEVWLPPKLLLVPAVPPALSLALPRDPCIQPSHTEVSVSRAQGWHGKAPRDPKAGKLVPSQRAQSLCLCPEQSLGEFGSLTQDWEKVGNGIEGTRMSARHLGWDIYGLASKPAQKTRQTILVPMFRDFL